MRRLRSDLQKAQANVDNYTSQLAVYERSPRSGDFYVQQQARTEARLRSERDRCDAIIHRLEELSAVTTTAQDYYDRHARVDLMVGIGTDGDLDDWST